jgi:hypothetical protein
LDLSQVATIITRRKVRAQSQRYLIATLDDTNKVERWHFCVAYLPVTDVRVLTQHQFHSNSPASPGIIFCSIPLPIKALAEECPISEGRNFIGDYRLPVSASLKIQ